MVQDFTKPYKRPDKTPAEKTGNPAARIIFVVLGIAISIITLSLVFFLMRF